MIKLFKIQKFRWTYTTKEVAHSKNIGEPILSSPLVPSHHSFPGAWTITHLSSSSCAPNPQQYLREYAASNDVTQAPSPVGKHLTTPPVREQPFTAPPVGSNPSQHISLGNSLSQRLSLVSNSSQRLSLASVTSPTHYEITAECRLKNSSAPAPGS